MKMFNKIIILTVALFLFAALPSATMAEEPNGNLVLAAGETWGTYVPANYEHVWQARLPYRDDLTSRSNHLFSGTSDNWMFYMTRLVSSGYFGNPGWSWMSGTYVIDFANGMWAIEYNPTDEFAKYNKAVNKDSQDYHYATLEYNSKIPGAGDPKRDYHIPADGGAVLSPDRTLAYSVSAWPTQLGVDVKMTVYSWTTPWGHLDDFHLIELELKNTGEADINGDGVVDIHNNKIHDLVFTYGAVCFGFKINSRGGRSYWQPNSRFRGMGQDLTPDENGAPWDFGFQAYGSDPGREDYPGLGYGGFYYDAYNGYTFLGAKKYDPNTGTWVEKKLAFKDANGNEVVPAVGEGTQRGWFHTWQPGYNSVNDYSPRGAHICAMGCFYKDGGKSNDRSMFDLSPNPNLFESGTPGDPTTFVVKDPSQWGYPDGAYESVSPTMAKDPMTGEDLGLNPLDPQRGRPLEPGIIKNGLITEYRFDGEPWESLGPISIDVGETVRVYFVRGSGFRVNGLRKTIKAARTVFKSIQPDGSFDVPAGPPVPEIKIGISPDVRPLIEWQDPASLGDYDGIKIYKSRFWPRFNPLKAGFPEHDVWWKTMDPKVVPDPVPYNPLFKALNLVYDQSGAHWGPYHLVATIPKAEMANYANTGADAKSYPYAWKDDTPGTLPGFSFWYYVSTYKDNSSMPADFKALEPSSVTWQESGKVNFNGRTGLWEGTWPQAETHSWFPKPSEQDKRKALGARFVLVPPPANTTDLALDRTKISVRPNPLKRQPFHSASGQLMFFNLPSECDIYIFDVAGQLIDKIHFLAEDPTNGTYFWDGYSKDGNEVASGLYIWVAKFKGGQQTGVFSILK